MIATSTNSKAPAHWIRPRQIIRQKGQRGCAVGDLQLICGAGPFELDVLLQLDGDGGQLEIIGQVTRGGALYEPVTDLSVHLVKAMAATSCADTETDQFGEFDLHSDPTLVYGLRLGNEDDAPCVLVWEGEEQ